MILSSCTVFPFSWPRTTIFLISQGVPMGKWVWNSLSILQAPFPSWRRGSILKSRFCLTTMNPQAGLGRHQEGGLNCCELLLGSMMCVLHSPW
jgi:hypothetical protein